MSRFIDPYFPLQIRLGMVSSIDIVMSKNQRGYMMSDTNSSPKYREITRLSNSDLAKRTQAALDAFIQAIKQGGNVAEQAQTYNAYQDERLRRLKPINLINSLPEKSRFRRGIIFR
jgi:hypothetical protein